MRSSVIVLLALGLIPACSATPRGLSWTIDFESTALHDQTSVVEARILRGTCTGVVLYRSEVRASARMAMHPPELPPGTYAFYATAYDASCTVIGDDCQSVTLPGPTSVTNLLSAHAGSAACPAALCHTGSCEMDSGVPDAGPADTGGVDVGTSDVGPGDAAACLPSEIHCTDLVDEDCDGHTDCSDPDCATTAECALCMGVVCAVCESCNPATGTCGPAADGDSCTNGHCLTGACCTGCVQGGVCHAGTADGTCGQGGLSCASCAECTACSAGSCLPAVEGSGCGGGAGRCASGACCTGCRDGTGACNAGSAPTACGGSGSPCEVCSECQSCTGVGCLDAMDGTSCSTGHCLSGACCNGCFQSGRCQPGNTVSACGLVGSLCATCGECQTCDATGTCRAGADGPSCMGGAGSCHGGACCTGCMSGGVCHAGTADAECGYFGYPCASCPSGGTCSNQVCQGIGSDCFSFIDISAIGTYVIPLDTCSLGDSFTWPGCFGGMPAPPAGTPDAVFRGVNPGTYQFHVDPGITVGSLDDFGSCGAPNGECADGSWNVSGSTGNSFYYFGVELSAGGCGHVTVTIDHPF